MKTDKVEIHHLFLILCCIYIIFSKISFFAGIVFLLSGIIFYISYNIGKKINNINLFYRDCKKHYYIGIILMVIGFLATVGDLIWVRDIPLFYPEVRRFLSVPLTMLSRFFIVGWAIVLSSLDIDKKRAIIYTLVFSIFVMLLGYRTSVFVLLISSTLILYYKNKINNREIILLFGIIFFIILGLSILRFLVLGVWGNPITSRISLTMSVYDIIYNYYNGAFSGYLLYSAIYSYLMPMISPRAAIAMYLGIKGVTITPTIVGAVIGDYGTLAIFPYFGILGIYLGYFYKIAKNLKCIYLGIFAIVSSYLLVGVESGILDFDVILYFLVGGFLCLYVTLKSKLKR
ncbi:oligosaccharide repeat unit polymerase family protein [Methanocaldococcus indicus]|uniref:oligosaccharide repeat unit polymerase family protein n=1 Tax=Methanocaldococcus indicus TaxID=213231 RepID=UPI003C6D4B47